MTSKLTEMVLASANQGKLQELGAMLAPLDIGLRSIAEWSKTSPPEDAPTFVENALIKARYSCECSGLPCLADDSGIIVPALGGAPGVHSARYAQQEGAVGNASDSANRRKLLQEMEGLEGEARRAYFVCVLVLLRHRDDPMPLIVNGEWHGSIAQQEQGSGGFGYDPIFYVPELGKSAAELSPEQKNSLSHRGQASRKLIAAITRWQQ